MRSVAILVGPLATLALVLAFGWPVLFVCSALSLATLLLSTRGPKSAELSTAARQPVHLVDAPTTTAADL